MDEQDVLGRDDAAVEELCHILARVLARVMAAGADSTVAEEEAA